MPNTPASEYVKHHDNETKYMYFLIEGDELFKKYHDIWNKVGNSIKKNLTVSPSTIKNSENHVMVIKLQIFTK